MRTTRESPKCPECVSHDAETQTLVKALFSTDEQTFLTMLVASTIQYRTEVLNKMAESDVNRLMVQRELDFGGCILGKFVVSLEARQKQAVLGALRKIGIVLNLQHEACPHQAQEGKPADG